MNYQTKFNGLWLPILVLVGAFFLSSAFTKANTKFTIPFIGIYKEGGGSVAHEGDTVVLKFSKKVAPQHELSAIDTIISDHNAEFFAQDDPNFYFAKQVMRKELNANKNLTKSVGVTAVNEDIIPEGAITFSILFINKKTNQLFRFRATTDGSRVNFSRDDDAAIRKSCKKAPFLKLKPSEDIKIDIFPSWIEYKLPEGTAAIGSLVRLTTTVGKNAKMAPVIEHTMMAGRYAGHKDRLYDWDPYVHYLVMDPYYPQGIIPFNICFRDLESGKIVGRVKMTTDGSKVEFIK
ncbi:MAG: hypothetical protein AAB588_03430 [Patescibacteria group bacterium]